MKRVMKAHPSWMVGSNEDGLKKVREGGYAYFMESTSVRESRERHKFIFNSQKLKTEINSFMH